MALHEFPPSWFQNNLEPEALKPSGMDSATVAIYSTAISTKRIADLLEEAIKGKSLEELVHRLGLVPMNEYGEGLVTGIQNAIARGQRGQTTF